MAALAPCALQRPRNTSRVVQAQCQRDGGAPIRPPSQNEQTVVGRRALLSMGAAVAATLVDPRFSRAAETRVALITGSNSGIGFATAQILMEQGWTTVLACRSVDSAEQAAARLGALGLPGTAKVLQGAALDLGDLAAVRAYAKEYAASGLPLDALVNNAGIMAAPEGTTTDGLESHFGVNHGHFALTQALLPAVRDSKGRVVHTSSLASLIGQLDLTDLTWQKRKYERWSAYGASKLANVLFSQELARREGAAGTGVVSNVCHPGVVATNLARFILPADVVKGARDEPEKYERRAKFLGLRSPREGAAAQVWLAQAGGEAGRSGPQGLVYTDPGKTFKVPMASGPEGEKLARDLWALSEDLVAAAGKGEKAGALLLAARTAAVLI